MNGWRHNKPNHQGKNLLGNCMTFLACNHSERGHATLILLRHEHIIVAKLEARQTLSSQMCVRACAQSLHSCPELIIESIIACDTRDIIIIILMILETLNSVWLHPLQQRVKVTVIPFNKDSHGDTIISCMVLQLLHLKYSTF